jgi:hypothetical protein
LPNSDSGRLLEALADPVNRTIVERLLIVRDATPGAIAQHVAKRFKIAQTGVSTRITLLETRHVVERGHDGTISLTDREELERIVQAARRLISRVLAEASTLESADHALLARRMNAADALLGLDAGRWPEPVSIDDMQLLDAMASQSDSERAALRAPPRPFESRTRRASHKRPAGWPAIVWICAHDQSRTEGDLLDAPARYLPAPARLLIVNADWPPFTSRVDDWALRYGDQYDVDFFREVAYHELELLVETVLADAILASERDQTNRTDFSESALREIVQRAMPKLGAELKRRLHQKWKPPRAEAEPGLG